MIFLNLLVKIKINLYRFNVENIVYIEDIGYCKEITIDRYNQYGINEPYNIYEPIS